MKLFGTLQNGQVQLDEPSNLPDGTRIVSMKTTVICANSNTRIP